MDPCRDPAVAGRFYTANPVQLGSEVTRLIGNVTAAAPARALVVPHAGYVYSGAVAGRGYRDVVVPQTAVVLCPNHTGLGARCSIWASGCWRIPGAELEIDASLAASMIESSRSAGLRLEPDRLAHTHEHSAEVHLPFLRARRPDVRIVPLCLARLSWAECEALGKALAAIIAGRQKTGEDVLVVASSDMSHYVSAATAHRLDHLALGRVEALDPAGLLRVVAENDISMCGVIPTAVALVAALELGANTAEITAYGNSGQTSGDLHRVVGYAAAVIR